MSNSNYLVAKVTNTFVYSVKSYSEVSSRDSHVASDKNVGLLFESWFRNHPNITETRGKVSKQTLISS